MNENQIQSEEQQLPLLLDRQENEPVNFAGIPLRLLKPHSSKYQVVHDFEIITKNLEVKRIKVICDMEGFDNEEEAAAINEFICSDSSAIAFVNRTSLIDKATGQAKELDYHSFSPLVRVGHLKWSRLNAHTWKPEVIFTVDRNKR
ncbi:hypothetical protein [Rufibacter sp. XAAS-G3-1]|uniref:hypothetical protein n=1 Tax=Rufibacter sp. XAAS-G3-1 TaxID=2729134 RepID=UPI0015E79CA2|nr:hypothetical protein [Rufibacter sp. XAAS-G3-1]